MRPLPSGAWNTLADRVRFLALERGEKIAFATLDRKVSFAGFDKHCSQVANGFSELGIKPGHRVAYLCRNDHVVYEILFSAAKAGVIATGLNWRLSAHELAYILEDSEAKLLFVEAEFASLASNALDLAGLNIKLITTGAEYEAWRDAKPAFDPQIDIDPKDIVCQLYTSGTTGRPKGVMLSHRSFSGQLRCETDFGPTFDMDESGVAMVAAPLFHIGGLAMGTASFLRGRKTVFAEATSAKILEAIETHLVTTTFLVPAQIQALLDDPSFTDKRVASLKLLRYGASAISPALLRRARGHLACGLVQMYGMTECTGAVGCLPPEDHTDGEYNTRLASCGRPFAHVEYRTIDATGKPLGFGEVGEVLIRTPSIMEGYWKRPEATQEAFADGWYKTGDAGLLDKDGYLYLSDRVKDMIITGGENVYPAEVENAICENEAVQEAAVIGVPDPRWGEAVKAFIVLKPGHTATAEKIIQSVRERIAGFKTPKTVEFVDALPRNSAGKVLRRELRAPYWEGHSRQIG